VAYRYKFTYRKRSPEKAWEQPGKPEWPNVLDVDLSRRDALHLLQHLASELLYGEPDERILLAWVGELAPNEDELE